MHTPSAIAAKPLPKRTRSTAGLEEIDAWLGQITSDATSTTGSLTPSHAASASTTASAFHFHDAPFTATLGASRKRHHSLPAAAIAGSLHSLATLKDKSTGSAAVRRPELALFAGEGPQLQQSSSGRRFSNQFSPSLRHDDMHALDAASYGFMPSVHPHQELPTPTSNDSLHSHHQTHSHALPPPLQLPEMSPREDFLVRAFVSDAMKLEGGGYEGGDGTTHGASAFGGVPSSSSSSSSSTASSLRQQRASLEIPTTPTTTRAMHLHGKDVASPTPAMGQLQPPQQHHKWTREEDEKLRDAVSRFGGKSWKLIAEMLGNGRTDVQCLHRWNKVLKPGLVKGPWTPEEDRVLLALIARYGVGQIRWCDVALHLPGRIGKQCRERWCNHLDSSIRKGQWTPQEDDTVFRLQQTIGNKWSEIAKHLPGRTENAVKNRFNSAARRKWLMSQANATGGGAPAVVSPSVVPTPTAAGKAPRSSTAPRGARLPRSQGANASGGGGGGLFSKDLLAGPPRPPAQPTAHSAAFLRGVPFPTTSFVPANYAGFGDGSDELTHHPMGFLVAPPLQTHAENSDLARAAFSFHPTNAFAPPPSSSSSSSAFRTPFLGSAPASAVSSPSLASLTSLLAEPARHDLHTEQQEKDTGNEPHDSPFGDDDSSALAMDGDHADPDDDNQVAHSPSVRRASLSAVAVGVDKRRLSVDASSVAGSRHSTEEDAGADNDDDDSSLRAIDLPDSDAERRQPNDDEDEDENGGGASPVDMDDQNMSTFLDSVALELDDML